MSLFRITYILFNNLIGLLKKFTLLLVVELKKLYLCVVNVVANHLRENNVFLIDAELLSQIKNI